MSTKEQKQRIESLPGTRDLLIPRTLLLGPTPGHILARAIEFNAIDFNSDDILKVEQGSPVRVGTSWQERSRGFLREAELGTEQESEP